MEAGNASLVLDLAKVEYISSAGFRSLLLLARQATQTRCRLVLCASRRRSAGSSTWADSSTSCDRRIARRGRRGRAMRKPPNVVYGVEEKPR